MEWAASSTSSPDPLPTVRSAPGQGLGAWGTVEPAAFACGPYERGPPGTVSLAGSAAHLWLLPPRMPPGAGLMERIQAIAQNVSDIAVKVDQILRHSLLLHSKVSEGRRDQCEAPSDPKFPDCSGKVERLIKSPCVTTGRWIPPETQRSGPGRPVPDPPGPADSWTESSFPANSWTESSCPASGATVGCMKSVPVGAVHSHEASSPLVLNPLRGPPLSRPEGWWSALAISGVLRAGPGSVSSLPCCISRAGLVVPILGDLRAPGGACAGEPLGVSGAGMAPCPAWPSLQWMRARWTSDPCYAFFGVDGTECSFLIYLSEVEWFCPPLPWRNQTAAQRASKPLPKVQVGLGDGWASEGLAWLDILRDSRQKLLPWGNETEQLCQKLQKKLEQAPGSWEGSRPCPLASRNDGGRQSRDRELRSGPLQAVFRSNLSHLLDLMGSGKESLIFMKKRTKRLTAQWVLAAQRLAQKLGATWRDQKQILVHIGFLTEESGDVFSPRVLKGGPLGEMVQWADILAALYVLGHGLRVTVSLKELQSGFLVSSRQSLPTLLLV
ncbi:hypothetical protein P7K49_011881 [Saguinus oedipus]|uniref:alpha-1,6-mannosyl-glycoprotein 6-beta-N-acetylglucosaminyltransferase n=1 Tax=Saguinus oedipus TaxID=9490 RepID=A0ABQ9VTF8_SAGOE|nr:hypothetical protein P7K49_011881 [Saguinus oedipus]